MKLKLRWWHKHKWGKWTQYTLHWHKDGKIRCVETRQKRSCLECNKMEDVLVCMA